MIWSKQGISHKNWNISWIQITAFDSNGENFPQLKGEHIIWEKRLYNIVAKAWDILSGNTSDKEGWQVDHELLNVPMFYFSCYKIEILLFSVVAYRNTKMQYRDIKLWLNGNIFCLVKYCVLVSIMLILHIFLFSNNPYLEQ